MTYIKSLLLILVFSKTIHSFTQQISSFGNVDMIDSYYNPAFTAFENDLRTTAFYRILNSDSPNFSDRWREAIVLAEMDLEQWNSGVGLKLHQDNNYLSRKRNAELNYRYSFRLAEHSQLSLGLSGGYTDFFLDTAGLIFPDGGTPENFYGDLRSGVLFNTGMGYNWNNRLYLGASVIQINEPLVGDYKYSRHYALHGQYMISISESFQLQPQFLWLFTKNQNMLRVNIKGHHLDRFWWMVSTGHSLKFMAAAGIRLFKHLDIGYGFDLFGFPNDGLIGTFHEITVSYKIRK